MAVLDTMRTDIMHKAAVTIQRHARGFVVRRQTHRTRRAVIRIQVPTFLYMHAPCYLLVHDDAVLCTSGWNETVLLLDWFYGQTCHVFYLCC